MFNVSNRYVDLERVVAAGLRARGLPVLVPLDPSPGSPPEPEKEPAGWVVSARSAGDLDPLAAAIGSRPSPVTTPRAWTDDFSDLVSAIQWDR
jgi:hypothetical protein